MIAKYNRSIFVRLLKYLENEINYYFGFVHFCIDVLREG